MAKRVYEMKVVVLVDDEHLDSVNKALTALVRSHPAFETAGVEVSEAASVIADGISADDNTDELDEFETGVYVCRWPNGDFSMLTASSRRDAIIALDEWGAAHPSYLHPVNSFMAD